VRSLPLAHATITLVLLAAACGGSSAAEPASPTALAPTEAADTRDGQETGPVQATGEPLPNTEEGGILNDAASDPAIGKIAPVLTGTSFNGTEVTIGPDGRAKVVYFLAHWCGHCQTEVKLIEELASAGKQPDEVDLYAIAIATREDADNYPPSAWLSDFPGTVMRDSSENEAGIASGVSGIPYALYLDGENRVMSRSVGSISDDQMLSQWTSLVPQNP
jgi:thiol-disulfide isomerase/thioredoxin